MKTYIITLYLMALSGILRAGHQSELTINSFDHTPISVVFDGAAFWQPNAEYSFPNITGGSHQLKVCKWMQPSWNCAPVKQLVFKGGVNLPYSSRIYSVIDCHGNFVISQILPGIPTFPPACCTWHGEHGGHCEEEPVWDPEPQNPWGGCGNGGAYGNYIIPMNLQEFSALKNIVDAQGFDSYKVKIIKQALLSNYVTTSQVAQLMHMLTFDSYKLDIAKCAYNRTLDKQNYYLVNSAFTFSSSIDELNRFIY